MAITYREVHAMTDEPIGFVLRRIAIRTAGERVSEYRDPLKAKGTWGPFDPALIRPLLRSTDPLLDGDQFEVYPDPNTRCSAVLYVLDADKTPVRLYGVVDGGTYTGLEIL